jgi:hypothetical protein
MAGSRFNVSVHDVDIALEALKVVPKCHHPHSVVVVNINFGTGSRAANPRLPVWYLKYLSYLTVPIECNHLLPEPFALGCRLASDNPRIRTGRLNTVF